MFGRMMTGICGFVHAPGARHALLARVELCEQAHALQLHGLLKKYFQGLSADVTPNPYARICPIGRTFVGAPS